MSKQYDYVSIISAAVFLLSLLLPDFIHYKETRISISQPLSAQEYLGGFYWLCLAAALILLLLAVVKKKDKRWNFISGIYASLTLVLVVFLSAISVNAHTVDGIGRFSFGVGFIIAVIAIYSVMLKCQQYITNPRLKLIVSILAWVIIGVMLVQGTLNGYSVMQEYIAQKAKFAYNVIEHIKLSFSALLVAVVIGVPWGYSCYKNSTVDKITIVGLSITETMPQLALFAIIRIPFIYLTQAFPVLIEWGFGGYGFAPAFTALFLYALYLIIHNVRAAFHSIDPALLENAVAMGMKSKEVFWKVQLPSALPYIMNGIRIAMISTIVGASLSSFVGAAGLGVYIVNGINALAIDLQLLGIIPIFIITVIADLIMGKLIKALLPNGDKNK